MNYAIELGLEGLRRHPRTMALAVFTMALGLASTMTMLTLLAMLSSDPLPGISQHLQLAWVDSREPARSGERAEDRRQPPVYWKLGDAQALMRARPQLRQSALVSTPVTLQAADATTHVSTSAVLALGPMPSMFGVPMRDGRAWTQAEEDARTPVLVLSQRLSERLFGSGDGVGRELRLGRTLFRVIGISGDWAPRPHVHYLQPDDPRQAWGDDRGEGLFVPVQAALDAGVAPMGTRICDGDGFDGVRFDHLDINACRWLLLWAEVNSPAQLQDYRTALLSHARQRHADGIFARAPAGGSYSVPQWLDHNRVVPAAVRVNLWLALALFALCMLNVAGLLAARFLRRSGELGVRRVLGASRRAIVVQCLVESGSAGLLGGLLALPMTWFGLWVVRLQDHGYTDVARLQPGLYLVLLVLALATGLLVGAIPAWRAARLSPALQVKTL